ncbi:methionyl-tRNA formyltransferase [Alloacidobacterium dinghuense]|uniref:Methionyl-tRNA formyltransferase n=1 Tax=Alloacidobacterium dinghuense TaxID=2763107 RepID=A0A7G8BHV2_9BACT|nr:methionyl-tRNA formyltransferase [Alloacidobacterium dinghuense]QNI32122.1 methionyl-tRNA formyltransferase [Alloacidobacterium dinghuense]
MRLVFCGTPQFAVPTLKALLRAGHDIRLVVTQPDRPSGRGMQLVAPPVKHAALAAGIPIAQPEKIKNNQDFRAQLEMIQPEAIIVVAYGRIIPKWMLDLPHFGNLNLHASLLPKYRGAAPIQWAVANGEPVTGATTMRIDEGLDTGDMLMQRELPIAPDHTAEDIFPLLAEMGAPLMVETLERLTAGTINPRKQDDSQATLAPILKREDGQVDFTRSAMEIYNRWRGFQPWPGAYTQFRGKKLAFHHMMPMELRGEQSVPGEVGVEHGQLFVDCGANSRLEIFGVQAEGKKRMSAADFLRGHQLTTGDRLG